MLMTTDARAADHLRSLLTRCRAEGEGELLSRFASARDGDAFAGLLARHGPMVLGLCRRVLGDAHDAEDAFQATFLALAQKAASIRRPESLAAWLHSTALRLALKARQAAARQQARPVRATPRPSCSPLDELSARELLAVLDEELQRLPEIYQLPLILCCTEGLSQEEAARRLGWSRGSVKGRLERGRARLRERLGRRGLAPAALAVPLLLTGGAAASVPPALSGTTLAAATTGRGASPAAVALARGLTGSASLARLRAACVALLMAGALGSGAGLLAVGSPDRPAAVSPPAHKERPPRVDLHGDPLPDGAVLRLGTLRLRAVGAKLAFSPDGTSVVGVRGDKYVSTWDAATGKRLRTHELATSGWGSSEFSPDGRRLATYAEPGKGVLVWDVQTGRLLRELAIPGSRYAMPVAFSADGARLAAVGQAGNKHLVRAWDLDGGKEVFAADVTNDVASGLLAFAPDGRRLLASFGSENEGIYCWDVATRKRLWQAKGDTPRSVAFTRDGKVLCPTPRMPALDLATGLPARGAALPRIEWGSRLTITPDGRTLLVAQGGDVVVWDLVGGKPLRTLAGVPGDLVVAPDGKTALTNDGILQRWDLATGKPLYADNSHQGHTDAVTQVVFSADGRRLASGSRDGTVRLWDATTGRPLRTWAAHSRRPLPPLRGDNPGVRVLDMTPDGRRLLSGGADGRLRLWDADGGREVRSFRLPPPPLGTGEGSPEVFHARIADDGATAVVLFGAMSGKVAVGGSAPRLTHKLASWDLKTGNLLRRHEVAPTYDAASNLSPGGLLLVSKGVLVDARSGKELARLEGVGQYGADGAYAFSGDGLLVVGRFTRTALKDGVPHVYPDGARVWEALTGKVVAHLRTKPWGRQLAFHPDSRFVAVNELDSVSLVDVRTDKVLFSRRMPEWVSGCLAFSRDGRRLATGHPDSTILLWNVPPLRGQPDGQAEKQPESLWDDLRATDAGRAWRAVWRLAETPGQALPLLRRHLKPALPAPDEVTRPLIADLDGKSFRRREDSVKRLTELGGRAEPALRAALAARPSLEQRQRIEALLAALTGAAPPSPDSLRELRAVAALRLMNDPGARRVLEELARGIPSSPTTRLARIALGME